MIHSSLAPPVEGSTDDAHRRHSRRTSLVTDLRACTTHEDLEIARASGGGTLTPADRAELIEGHMLLARSLARRFANRGELLEDLEQVAMSALVAAANRFDPAREIKFSTFATSTILGTLKRHFRDSRWGVHVNRSAQERYLAVRDTTDQLTTALGRRATPGDVARALHMDVEDVMAARDTEVAVRISSLDATVDGVEGVVHPMQVGVEEHGFAAFEARADVARALTSLGDREAVIVRMRFVEGLTQAEIGDRLGISQMQVSRILARSLAHVRASLR